MVSGPASPTGSASNSPSLNGTRLERPPRSSLREIRTAPNSEDGEQTPAEGSAPPSPLLAKPLPSLPFPRGMQVATSHSSPSLAAQNNTLGKPYLQTPKPLEDKSSSSQPSLRQLALASSASSPLPPPPSTKALLTQNPNPSENWTGPEDADGAYVRKTYDWFDRHGVTGDGLVEGREWTRERGNKAVWQQPKKKRPSSSAGAVKRKDNELGSRSGHSPFPTGSAMRAVVGPDGKLSPSPHTQPLPTVSSNAQSSGRASPSYSHVEVLDSPTSTGHPTSPSRPSIARVPSTSTIATHSEESAYSGEEALEGTLRSNLNPEDEVRHQQAFEENEKARTEMLRKIDRYGFFAKDEGDLVGKGRITILTERAFSSFPKKRLRIGNVNPGSSTISTSSGITTRRGALIGAGGGGGIGASASFVVTPSPSIMADNTLEEARRASDGLRSDSTGSAEDYETKILRQISSQRSSNAYAARPKESLRVAKWAHMLQVEGAKISSSSSDGDSKGAPSQKQNSFSYQLSDKATKTEARRKKLKSRVYKGVPDRWRAAAWWAMLTNDEKMLSNSVSKKGRKHNPDASSDPASSLSNAGTRSSDAHASTLFQSVAEYFQLTMQPSTHDVQIDLDVPRTISGHYLFHTRYGQGQRSLFHVLHAFSLLCPQCGYCQGMGPIAATLLVYLPPERAYATLVHLHDYTPPSNASSASSSLAISTAEGGTKYGLHETFSPGFPGLGENFYVQRALCPLLGLGPVLEVLDDQMISTSAYATKWYITLYANVVSFETQLRIWDAFVCIGKDVLVGVALGLLWALRNRIMGREKVASGGKSAWEEHGTTTTHSAEGPASFETILEALTAEFLLQDDDGLMRWVERLLARDDVVKRIAKARREYRTLVEAGKQPMML
ncbi:hypothetical protein FA10DRAFT_264128 [Acaromyces ingoldii]|uniref:Rab-GAP TBC domain-containing protein n=1 Tax=Acaromyces ingoldii TaxID=215250 RepID=A0A316YXK1_9BASI|nr:hypothetical protein FA10DRAFT_264128 [Acaromyces ingoldii]PWN93484.1 hypothetical protein FA10DRAFT_264128 [Acaromyces ingoldii]